MFQNNHYLNEIGITSFLNINIHNDLNNVLSLTNNQAALSDDILHLASNPKEYIIKCASVLKENNIFVLCDTIVHNDDAIINTDEYLKNQSHRRFYRMEEIIDFTKDFFRLEYFYRKNNKGIFIFTKI